LKAHRWDPEPEAPEKFDGTQETKGEPGTGEWRPGGTVQPLDRGSMQTEYAAGTTSAFSDRKQCREAHINKWVGTAR